MSPSPFRDRECLKGYLCATSFFGPKTGPKRRGPAVQQRSSSLVMLSSEESWSCCPGLLDYSSAAGVQRLQRQPLCAVTATAAAASWALRKCSAANFFGANETNAYARKRRPLQVYSLFLACASSFPHSYRLGRDKEAHLFFVSLSPASRSCARAPNRCCACLRHWRLRCCSLSGPSTRTHRLVCLAW